MIFDILSGPAYYKPKHLYHFTNFEHQAKEQEQYESEFEKNAALDTSDITIDDNIDTEMLLVSNALMFFLAGNGLYTF